MPDSVGSASGAPAAQAQAPKGAPVSDPAVAEAAQGLEAVVLGPDGQPLSKKALKKLEKEKEKEAKRVAVAARLAAEQAARDESSPDWSKDNYAILPLNQSQTRPGLKQTKILDLSIANLGETVNVTARIHTSRSTSPKMTFFTFRQQFSTVQGVVVITEGTTSKQMVKFAKGLSAESLVLLTATVVKPLEPVKSCTVSDVELKITKLFVVSEAIAKLPFNIEDASRSQADIDASQASETPYPSVALDTRLNHRVVDLRTTANQAIFRMQHGVSRLFREFLESRNFMEIHSPKLINTASEGGANVFKVSYFKTDAFLAQSPQLYKQMCICSDFDRVFEIAPVFRAENSMTHRHMTEFTGVDMEMAFSEHYHEVLDVLDEMFVFVFKGLKERYAKEIAAIKQQFPFEDFRLPEKTVRLKFADAIKLLRDDGVEIGDYDDMNTETERRLGRLVAAKYHTDFFILDKFPLAIRPFYTMPDPANPKYSNSYDFFVRGEEIMSGAQRVHDVELLKSRAMEHGVNLASIAGYLDAFKYGAPPHAGGGIGLERVIMLYLNLGNIRRVTLFPRDPRRLEP